MTMLTREMLKAQGWADRHIDLALDAPDEYGPGGYWASPLGLALYDPGRVAVAAWRLGLGKTRPDEATWQDWRHDRRPSSLPVFTLSFHRIAEACIPETEHEFRDARIAHRLYGQRPGGREEEDVLIARSLAALLGRCGTKCDGTWPEVEAALSARAACVAPPWQIGGEVLVRRMEKTSRASKATSAAALARALDALALVHAGTVRNPWGEAENLRRLLHDAPALRFDAVADPL